MRRISTLRFFICTVWVIAATGTTIICAAQERMMGGVGITVFADQNFRGKSATFREDVPNLDPLGLNDKVSSLRVGPGERWEICEHADYQGRCVVVSGDESDLRRNSWNDLVSSFRRIGGGYVPPPPSSGDAYIVLYDRATYRGTPANYDSPKPDLYLYNRRARSVTIGRGVWELCEGRNYTGRCITLDQSIPDLRTLNFHNRVSSVRPAGPRPTPRPATGTSSFSTARIIKGVPRTTSVRKRILTSGRGASPLVEEFGNCATVGTSQGVASRWIGVCPILTPMTCVIASDQRPLYRQPR